MHSRMQHNPRQKTKATKFGSNRERSTSSYERKYIAVRSLLFMTEIIIFLVIQGTPGLIPQISGQKPILLIPIAITIAVFSSETTGMIFATICGLLTDAVSSNILGFYAMMLVVFGFLAGYMATNYIRTNLITAMVWATLAVPLILYIHFLFFYKIQGYGYDETFFISHYLPRIFYTWAVTPVFYLINKAIAKIGPDD